MGNGTYENSEKFQVNKHIWNNVKNKNLLRLFWKLHWALNFLSNNVHSHVWYPDFSAIISPHSPCLATPILLFFLQNRHTPSQTFALAYFSSWNTGHQISAWSWFLTSFRFFLQCLILHYLKLQPSTYTTLFPFSVYFSLNTYFLIYCTIYLFILFIVSPSVWMYTYKGTNVSLSSKTGT